MPGAAAGITQAIAVALTLDLHLAVAVSVAVSLAQPVALDLLSGK